MRFSPLNAARAVVRKATEKAGRLVDWAGDRVERAGERVGEAALEAALRVERIGQRLKEAGRRMVPAT